MHPAPHERHRMPGIRRIAEQRIGNQRNQERLTSV
jgi:hypothetical protein